MFGIFKRKNKNKDIDPVKEKQKLVNDSIKNSKMEKKKKKKNSRRLIDLTSEMPFLLHMTKKRICSRTLMETIS